MLALLHLHNLVATNRLCALCGPSPHQPAALLDHVGPAIGLLDLAVEFMCQRHLDQITRERLDQLTAPRRLDNLYRRRSPIRRPILERGTETMRDHIRIALLGIN